MTLKLREVLALVSAILVCELAGAAGSLFTVPNIPTWYALLEKPAIVPPSWVFAPVWTTLYFLMGIAIFRIWRHHGTALRTRSFYLFALQLILNVAWSAVFFGAHALGAALLVLILLWATIAACIWTFASIDEAAAWLLSPYLAWTTFAGILNASLWYLNH